MHSEDPQSDTPQSDTEVAEPEGRRSAWHSVVKPFLASIRAWPRWAKGVAVVLVLSALIGVELRTSWVQAWVLSRWTEAMTHTVEPGPSSQIRFPDHGPYDQRLGYVQLPSWVDTLSDRGFQVDAQARISDATARAFDTGLYPVYDHKSQAGLAVIDRSGQDIFRAQYPTRVYAAPDSVPRLVRETLLFIENRELLDTDLEYKNPAIEWDRLVRAVGQRLVSGGEGPGGSTLATQLAKVRHSPSGVTGSTTEKLRQMASASLQAYHTGPETVDDRHRIVTDYLNLLPLAATPGHGEVNGLLDGLRVWYGADVDSVQALLRSDETASGATPKATSDAELAARGRAYRQVLSLILSTRAPTRYLVRSDGPEALAALTDRYLPLLASAGILSPELRDAAAAATLTVRRRAPDLNPAPFTQRKASTAIRADLLNLFGVQSLSALDRFDLTAHTTFDRSVQYSVTEILQRMHDPDFLRQSGLVGSRLLGGVDPSQVTYSVVLYELGEQANVLRVQTDNFPGPFDVNRSSKLELGSTAKLRALVTYLELVERTYDTHRNRPPDSLRAVSVAPNDAITRWTLDQLLKTPDLSRDAILDAAMQRTYSASPGERFFTGGGVQTFGNFDRETAGPMTVSTAMRFSVNLVFVRMMRDVVNWHVARLPGQPARALEDASDTRRTEYLRRFADQEGRLFLTRYYRAYQSAAPKQDVLEAFGNRHTLPARRLAWAYRTIFPESQRDVFAAYLQAYATDGKSLGEKTIEQLYERSQPANLSWQDRGYLAGVHPLELWLLRYLYVNPQASLNDVVSASTDVRQDVYTWLFRKRKESQDPRIRTILEQEAFAEIHRMWVRLGYPFDRLVASYATALGSSADRPAALAELVGILLRDGQRYPSIRLDTLRFAEGTPYETVMTRRLPAPEAVLSPELCRVVRASMIDVVERGTAVRARGALRAADGTPLPIGGKTGTGDNRIQFRSATGSGSIALNRTSTFVFFAGDRFFGTVVAYVPGRQAEQYSFTSSLPASVLALIGPELSRL